MKTIPSKKQIALIRRFSMLYLSISVALQLGGWISPIFTFMAWVPLLGSFGVTLWGEMTAKARRVALSRIDDRRRRRETLKSLGHWPPVRYDKRKFRGDFKWVVVPKEGAE